MRIYTSAALGAAIALAEPFTLSAALNATDRLAPAMAKETGTATAEKNPPAPPPPEPVVETTATPVKNAIAVGQSITIGGKQYTVAKRVNRVLLKHADNAVVAVRIEGKFFEGKELKSAKDGAVKMAPARMAIVINLDTGEEMEYIVGSVLEGVLNEAYANDSYVGKSFMIRKSDIPGKRYKAYEAIELR